jgi:hypothetical protein
MEIERRYALDFSSKVYAERSAGKVTDAESG